MQGPIGPAREVRDRRGGVRAEERRLGSAGPETGTEDDEPRPVLLGHRGPPLANRVEEDRASLDGLAAVDDEAEEARQIRVLDGDDRRVAGMQLLESPGRVGVHPARPAGHPHRDDASLEATRALQLANRDGRSFLDRGSRPHADEDPDRIANLGIGPVIGEELVAARDARGEVATPEPHRLPPDERCGTSRHGRERRLIDARVGSLVQRLVDDVRGHDEPAHRHLAANQAEEGGREHERGRLPQPGREAPPNAAVCDAKPRPDRGADPDQDDGRRTTESRAIGGPSHQARCDIPTRSRASSCQVAQASTPATPTTRAPRRPRHRHGERQRGGAARSTGRTAGDSLSRRADPVADGQTGAARHALDDPAAGNERRRQRGEPEDEAGSEADGAHGAGKRCHAHSAISSISRQRTRCDADEGPLHHASRPRRWC